LSACFDASLRETSAAAWLPLAIGSAVGEPGMPGANRSHREAGVRQAGGGRCWV